MHFYSIKKQCVVNDIICEHELSYLRILGTFTLCKNFLVSKKANLYPVFHSVLVEDICDVFPVFSDGQQTLLHVEGAAGDQEEVEAGLGHLELAGLGVHRVPDVDRAALINRTLFKLAAVNDSFW